MKRAKIATTCLSLAAELALLWLPDEASAACSPASPVNNADVTCSGTTVDQNGTNGYGTNTDTGNTIAVGPGASVTGTGLGITFNTGTVLNSGNITGAGYGVYGGNAATVVNSGSISGSNGIGSIGAIIANVTNSGSIIGTSDGISTPNGTATVSNSGSITGGQIGIVATTAYVTNSGTITGTAQNGINASTATVINSGTITGGTYAIFGGTAVTNSGTIIGGTYGIGAGIGNVTNSGTISGGIAALEFHASADTLTLLPGSRIIGAIILAGGGDIVNFRTGNQNLTFDTLAGATVTSNVPFAVSGNRVATIDPTAFANANTTLMDFSRGISSVLGNRFGTMATAPAGAALGFAPQSDVAAQANDAFDAIPGLSAYASDAVMFKNPTVQYSDGTALWARGFAGQRVQQVDGALLHTLNQFYGGMIGGDRQVAANLSLGGFFGAGKTRSSLELNSGDTDSDLVFGGVFGRYTWGASFLNVALQGGYSHNATTRNINNNLAPGGLESATASYNGWYVNPEATVGHTIALGSLAGASYALTPSLQLRYVYGSFGGYTESGSTANLTVGSRTAQNFEERGQFKLARTQVFAPTEMLTASITGGVLGNQRVGAGTIDATLLGQAIPFATPGKDNVWGGFGGGGLEWRSGRVTLFATAEYLALSDSSTVISGQGGLRVAF